MDEDRRREIALYRYALIRDCADAALSKAERGALVRAVVAGEHVGPDGRLVSVCRTRVDDWIRAWRRGGFAALLPKAGMVDPRTAREILELAEALKRELPERTAVQVHQIMLAAGRPGVPTLRTVQRHFERVGLNTRPDGSPPRAFGRFQAAAHSYRSDPRKQQKVLLSGRRAVLLAFIDDYSRALVGWRWGTGEHVLGLEGALRSGLLARGVPQAILVDRGSAFVSSQLLRACAVLGIRLIHAAPRAATTKGRSNAFSGLAATSSWLSSGHARSLTWTSSTGCLARGWRSSTTVVFTARRRPRRSPGS
jgi:putative transposase